MRSRFDPLRSRVFVNVPDAGQIAAVRQSFNEGDEYVASHERGRCRLLGIPTMTRASFDAQRGPNGALLVGSPDEVTEKVVRHAEALGGISRISFQMNVASLPQSKMMRAIDAIGARVLPALHAVN